MCGRLPVGKLRGSSGWVAVIWTEFEAWAECASAGKASAAQPRQTSNLRFMGASPTEESLAASLAHAHALMNVRFGSEADVGPSLVEVHFYEVSGSVRGLQTKLQTNHATQAGIWDHKGHRPCKIAKPEPTISYCAARASMRILELENRCTGNRTVGSNPTSPFLLGPV